MMKPQPPVMRRTAVGFPQETQVGSGGALMDSRRSNRLLHSLHSYS